MTDEVGPRADGVAPTIHILTSPAFSAQTVRSAMTALEQQFRVGVLHHEWSFDLEGAFDRPRGQYLSAALIRQMETDYPRPTEIKILGMIDIDLFAPVLTFVFGEAQLGGSCAILSTFRLRNEFYGIPSNMEVLQTRVIKEAVHEVGHLFGLIHCRTFDCVMRSSTYVEEIDLKTENLCAECRSNLNYVEILNNETLSGMRREKIHRS